MREIKFRAWDILSKRIIYLNKEMSSIPYYELFCHTPDSRAMELMQYTGLKDKNGKEIYEGDITSLGYNGEYDAVIKWDNKKASFVADSIEGDCISDHLYGAELCEVIGNIHEKPELLEEKKRK